MRARIQVGDGRNDVKKRILFCYNGAIVMDFVIYFENNNRQSWENRKLFANGNF